VLDCEPLAGWRIIADPASLDGAPWPADATVVRISPDDVFVIVDEPPDLEDPYAIVTPERGFAGAELDTATLGSIAERHIEWPVPTARPTVAQGQVAGVPSKLVLRVDGTALLLVACAARAELEDRLNREP
jgi:hypothetical protein